jgi:hypothetical protein
MAIYPAPEMARLSVSILKPLTIPSTPDRNDGRAPRDRTGSACHDDLRRKRRDVLATFLDVVVVVIQFELVLIIIDD